MTRLHTLHSFYSALTIGLVLSFGFLTACSEPSSGGGSSTTPSTSGEGTETPCTTSAECDGQLCVVGLCRACIEDSFCADDPHYGAGATCSADGACVSCLGQDTCACDANETCQDGLVCQEGLCEPEPTCTLGELDCACLDNQTCNAGLRCNTDGLCEPCPPGEQGCGCQEGDLCNDELSCMEGLCVIQECVLGVLDCPCRDDDTNLCDENLTCTDAGMCAECSSDIEDCPCDEEGACQNDLVCDDEEQFCRTPRTCDELSCVTNQQCQPDEAATDAICLDACVEGFTFNPNTNSCDPIPEANCRQDAPASVLTDCTMLNRECVEEANSARCGACQPNFLEGATPMGACRPVMTCTDLTCATSNRSCLPHSPTTDAMCGACTDGFVEQNNVCAPIIMTHPNCQPGAEMSILDQCTGENRVCIENAQNAGCGDCLTGFMLDPNTQECVTPEPCDGLDCAVRNRSCDDAADVCGGCLTGFLEDPNNAFNCIDACDALGCADRGHTCEGEPAVCGGCLEGLILSDDADPNSDCRFPLTCAEVESTCEEGTFCVEGEGFDATCSTWPCSDPNGDPDLTRAFREDTGTCIDCGLTCDATGLAGTIWPFTLDNSNRCICETLPGYYLDTGGAFVARSCDGDDDGWVRSSARSSLDSQDTVLRTNARCNLKSIDRVVLENEYQQNFEVKLCVEGLVGGFVCETNDDCEVGRCNNGTCDCIEASPVQLYESVRNDDQNELSDASDTDVPMYRDGPRGRRFKATELNPLTRACVSVTADHNDNGVADINEYQGMETQGASTAEQIFTNFSYFVELYEGSYTRSLGDAYGVYTIREKSRCDDTFPVQINEALDGSYWRSCTRQRDAQFDRMNELPLIGYDFGAWTCSDEMGECAALPPLTDATPDDQVPPHGLCDDVALPPLDGVWRGMNHHSQFKCIDIVNTVPPDRDMAQPHLRTRDELADAAGVSGFYQLNACTIACPEGDLDCAEDCSGGACTNSSTVLSENPDLPTVSCRLIAREQALEGQVGFAAMRYSNSVGYTKGCINEWSVWKQLCPGYTASLVGQTGPISSVPGQSQIVGAGNPGNFGKLVCGCGFNYGGPECDMGCPGAPTECQGQECTTNQLFYGGPRDINVGGSCDEGYCPVAADGEGGGRRGWWACGSWDTTSYETEPEVGPILIHESGWSALGTVPKDGIGKRPLCESVDDCANGWAAH